MTPEALLYLALNSCPALPPKLAEIMVGVALHENHSLDPRAVNHNSNGTLDVGVSQINSSNFPWLGLTMQTAMDPCQSLIAGAKVLLVRYNGHPPDALKIAYANGALRSIGAVDRLANVQQSVSQQEARLNPLSRPVRAGRDLLTTQQ